jgi:hypothetical protein
VEGKNTLELVAEGGGSYPTAVSNVDLILTTE